MNSLIQTIKNLCKKMLNLKLNLDTCATLRAIGNGIRPFPYFLRIGLSPMGQQKIWAFFWHKKVQPYSQVCSALLMNKKIRQQDNSEAVHSSYKMNGYFFLIKKGIRNVKVCFHFFVPKKHPSFPSRFFIPIAKSGFKEFSKISFIIIALLLSHKIIIGFLNAEDLPGVPGKSAPASASKGSSTMPEGELPEVVIKGGEKSGVRSEKLPLEIELNPDEAVLPAMEPEKELLQRQPESLRNPSAGFSSSLSNLKTILPARIRLAKDPVKVFYPLREILANSPSQFQEIGTGWEMTITNSEGQSFRKFNGRGLPPATIPWNGRSERSEIVNVGKNYSMVITYKDTRGQIRNFVGEPFAFDGVLHQETKGLVISLALNSIFETTRKSGLENETIGDSGQDLLQETADWIKRHYFTYPVKIDCYDKDIASANAKAQAVAQFLRSLMLLPREAFPTAGYSANTGDERIEVIISNR